MKNTEKILAGPQTAPQSVGKSLRQAPKRPTIAPPPLPVKPQMSDPTKSASTSLNRRQKQGQNNNSLNSLGSSLPIDNNDLINVNIYSSDDEHGSSFNSDSDEEYNLDELCDSISVTSSIETHSVLYKNTRKN